MRVDMMSGSVQNENGGHIVGKGKAPFIGGTEISPTEINIVRPSGTKPLSKDILGSKLGGNK